MFATAQRRLVRLALCGSALLSANILANGVSDSSSGTADQDKSSITEIVVTAEKREERVQEVPIPMSVVNAESLVATNRLKLADYYTDVPGLTLTPSIGTPSGQVLTIRGVAAFGGTQTTGLMVDDLPLAISSANNGFLFPELDPGDMSRIEVLRGPQGTLYGSNSIGGLIKYVTIEPSTAGLSGNVSVGTDTIRNASGVGYNVRGSINVPLTSDLAIRASAFVHDDPGYLDNPILGIKGINDTHSEGVYLSTLWRPSETLSLRLTAILQKSYGGSAGNDSESLPSLGFPSYTAPIGDLQQTDIRGAGPYERNEQIYGLVLKDQIGVAELTAVSSYIASSFDDTFDISQLNGLTEYLYGPAGAGVLLEDRSRVGKGSQEVRVAAPLGQYFDLLVGGFYTYEASNYRENLLATNPQSGAVRSDWWFIPNPAMYTEYAGFTDLTYHPTDQFDIQVGVRESQIHQWFDNADYGPADEELGLGTSPVISPREHSYNNAFTYLVTPRYKFSPDLMVYARVASGYRPGGPNAVLPTLPSEYQPDSTVNYDLGVKGDFLDHRVSFDASVFYIDWKHIQLTLNDPKSGYNYTGNAGGAKSQGVELSVEAKPIDSLSIAGWVDFDDAVLKQTFPTSSGLVAVSGDRLPWIPRFSSHLSINQQFALTSSVRGFVGGALAYFGERQDAFSAPDPSGNPTPRQPLPAYAKTDLQGGVKFDGWTASLYANNVADRRGVLSGGIVQYPANGRIFYIQPRTIGLTVSRSF